MYTHVREREMRNNEVTPKVRGGGVGTCLRLSGHTGRYISGRGGCRMSERDENGPYNARRDDETSSEGARAAAFVYTYAS